MYFVVYGAISLIVLFIVYRFAVRFSILRRIKWHRHYNRFLLNVFWYAFIIVFLGQLGPIIGYAQTYWDGGNVWGEITKSAGKADLITCATAILAGGTFFLVREYNADGQIGRRGIKSTLILLASLIGLGCIGIAANLLASTKFSTDRQELLHWGFYASAIVLAFILWIFEELQGTANQEIREVVQTSKDITAQSKENVVVKGVKL